MIHLTPGDGHPALAMDMSFANQAFGVGHLVENRDRLTHEVHTIPWDIDAEVARLELKSMGVSLDRLTAEQEEYVFSWEIGT